MDYETFTTGERRLLAKFHKLPFGVRRTFSTAKLRTALKVVMKQHLGYSKDEMSAKNAVYAELQIRRERHGR